jgi:hypothetical protein
MLHDRVQVGLLEHFSDRGKAVRVAAIEKVLNQRTIPQLNGGIDPGGLPAQPV